MQGKQNSQEMNPEQKMQRIVEKQDNSAEPESARALSLSATNRERVPIFLRTALRERNAESRSNESGKNQQSESRKSRAAEVITDAIRAIRSSFTNEKTCKICLGSINPGNNKNEQIYISPCEHKQDFCQSCLHHYAIYKVKHFEEVMCPQEGCPATLDTTANFFMQLPFEIQRNYKKIHQMYLTISNPNIRLCPKQNCSGTISSATENVMVCNECGKRFCSQCLLEPHEGKCDDEEINFFQNNLHYRQCQKCKLIIEKNQGCNHMTCRCGYQFCYVCGDRWSPHHYFRHDQNGNPIVGAARVVVAQEQCCDCRPERLTCLSIVKFPVKLILFILLFLLLLIFIISLIMYICIGPFYAIMFGIIIRTCLIIDNLDGIWCVLAVIFFPITMCIGIIQQFIHYYLNEIPLIFRDFLRLFWRGAVEICQW